MELFASIFDTDLFTYYDYSHETDTTPVKEEEVDPKDIKQALTMMGFTLGNMDDWYKPF